MVWPHLDVPAPRVGASLLALDWHCRRFTRLTNAFSKKIENHAHSVALHVLHDILQGTGLDPDWEALLIHHADRFMVGTDTWVNSQWERYDRIIAASRLWLARLPRSVAEQIAYGNAQRLFGREVTENLIGRR